MAYLPILMALVFHIKYTISYIYPNAQAASNDVCCCCVYAYNMWYTECDIH